MEYVSETVATEAAKKYQNVELEAHKLYVIKAMTNRMMSFGKTAFVATNLHILSFFLFRSRLSGSNIS